jgi:hypothetical protein
MWLRAGAVVAALTLSGCAGIEARQAEETHKQAIQACRAQFPARVGVMVVRAQCIAQADYAYADAFPLVADLWHLRADTAVALSEKVDRTDAAVPSDSGSNAKTLYAPAAAPPRHDQLLPSREHGELHVSVAVPKWVIRDRTGVRERLPSIG